MALVHADRVRETSTTTGTGTYSLAGAADASWQTFVAGIGNGNTCHYAAFEAGAGWEVGVGTVTSGSPNTLARTSVLKSSNANAAVSWGAGTRTLIVTVAAARYRAIGENTAVDGLSAASQSDQEAGSSTSAFVAPGTQRHHPSAAKAWVKMSTSGGTVTNNRSFNISSITDNGAGDYTFNFSTAFSDAHYGAVGTGRGIGAGNTILTMEQHDTISRTTSALRVYALNASFAPTDVGILSYSFFGDQ